MSDYRIRPDDLTSPIVLDLLQLHLDEMHRWSPACKVHAMPAERLRQADVSFFAAWDGETLAAVGALKELDAERGELKSMRAAPAYRGKGAGKAILGHLLDEAKRRGYRWVGLETGGTPEFEPAAALYRSHGFVECTPFADYVSDEFSRCMELVLY
ncbi:MAG: GNAT family N-acetyltransferase [Alphaproteobacteria bacterium]|nr:MAG: GNAT family N-acetyltransferase [Alphaproteobacteria bacterium]